MELKLAEYLLTLSYFSRITAASKSCKKLQIGTCTNLKCSIVRGEEGNERGVRVTQRTQLPCSVMT